MDVSEFDMKSHAWEFDADRFATFEVLKYVFQIKRKLKINADSIFKSMLFLGLGSIFITKLLFYLGVGNSSPNINKQEFYTKKFSHPHPLVRLFNIIEYYQNNIEADFPDLKIDTQQFLNNTLGIVQLYFKSLLPNQDAINYIFKDLNSYLDSINDYNQELFDFAIEDKSVRDLLLARDINFE